MKKRFLALLSAVVLCLSMAACQGAPLSVIDRATADDLATIRTTLETCGVHVSTCEPAEADALADVIGGALPSAYAPYIVTDGEGGTFCMVINTGTRMVTAVVDEATGEFVFGGLNGVPVEPVETE